MRPHGPSSKARRAARTARSMSSASPSATVASISPVAGFGVSNVRPDAASTHWPSMNSWRLVAMKSSTRLSNVTLMVPPPRPLDWRRGFRLPHQTEAVPQGARPVLWYPPNYHGASGARGNGSRGDNGVTKFVSVCTSSFRTPEPSPSGSSEGWSGPCHPLLGFPPAGELPPSAAQRR